MIFKRNSIYLKETPLELLSFPDYIMTTCVATGDAGEALTVPQTFFTIGSAAPEPTVDRGRGCAAVSGEERTRVAVEVLHQVQQSVSAG